MIAIIKYGSGNVGAISNVLKQLKLDHVVTIDKYELQLADKYILPGVGAFDPTMRNLRESGVIDILNEEVIVGNKKILGICVGMQIMGDASDEGTEAGLGWIPGHIRKIDSNKLPSRPKLPHMGWNSILPMTPSPMFNNVDVNLGFYFLHSYFFDAQNQSDIVATVKYGQDIPCCVRRGNVCGMQFHPEKSHSNGVAIFRNFGLL